MNVLQALDLQALPQFSKQQQLAIVEREPLDKSDMFFQKLMKTPFSAIGQVSKKSSVEDIEAILKDDIPSNMQNDPFYTHWVADMAEVCGTFCDTLNSEAVSFFLGTERGCRRYHIDNVPMRLLVTYAGQGTEWLPDEAADRIALAKGAPNEDIIKDPSKRQFMNNWDIAIFRGGPKGLLHRTPDAALGNPSILMRLDYASFWDKILKQQQENKLSQAVIRKNA
jgi:hypothetical protein